MKFDVRKTLPTIREIGFQLWDPLGLAGMSKESELIVAEYDQYLISAFSTASKGHDVEDVCRLLLQAEIHMGLMDGGSKDRRVAVAGRLLRLVNQPV